jgi:hypothetical protein
MWQYFNHKEFESPDAPGSGEEMDVHFVDALDHARSLAGVPFKITSGFRTTEHNERVGGVPSSAHTLGLAADIAATSSRDRFAIVHALLLAGFDRIGIARDFVHVDASATKSGDVLWLYK